MYGEKVNRIALAHNLRADVVACIILQESNGDPFAYRYEDGFFNTYLKNKALVGYVPKIYSKDTEARGRAFSWGLMQVMGETARWCANYREDSFGKMLDPEIGIEVGCRVLAYYLQRENGDYKKALSRYNSGTANSDRGLAYADKVLGRIAKNEHLKILR